MALIPRAIGSQSSHAQENADKIDQRHQLLGWLFIAGGDASEIVHPKKRPQSQTAMTILYPEGVASASASSTAPPARRLVFR